MLKYFFYRSIRYPILIAVALIIFPDMLNAASWGDVGAYTYTWYNKNKKEFHISTPEEMAGVAYLVNNNLASFKDKTIYIDADLNFAGRTWKSIGTSNTDFQGTIIGDNHTFSNIEISDDSSELYDKAGFWISLLNAHISDLRFQGKLSKSVNIMGMVAAKANNSTFENIIIDYTISFFQGLGSSTSYSYNSTIGGLIGESNSGEYNHVYTNGGINYLYGYSDGSSCYGHVEATCGGIVGSGTDDKLFKCVTNNKFYSKINGYKTTTIYSTTPSTIKFGGIIGNLGGNNASIIACLARNISFKGEHGSGTFDEVSFQFGGLAGVFYEGYNSKFENSVAINSSYIIEGNDYTWQAAFYKTNSYFGNIVYYTKNSIGGCYSNSDVNKSLNKVAINLTEIKGNANYSSIQMNTQEFVDELNFYSQLKYDNDYWTLRNGILFPFDERLDSGVSELVNDPQIIDSSFSIYDIQGHYIGKRLEGLLPGIYIIKSANKTKKIIL